MKLGAIPAGNFPSIGYAISASRGGKASLPVAPSAYIYSHFRHVSGVPAPQGVQGVAVSKLKILDTLIEQLARLKKQPEPSYGPAGQVSEDRINAMIEQYENQLRTAKAASIQRAGPASPYRPTIAPPGTAFSLTL
jgi:hypothetical protein